MLMSLIGGLGLSQSLRAQEKNEALTDTINKDDLGLVTDEFQELFFKALSDRAIENYDRAIESLKKAQAYQQGEPAVYFELGKNYFDLEDFLNAERYLKKALEKQPDDEAVLSALNELYRETHAYQKAIPIVDKLSRSEVRYKEELAELYFSIKDYSRSLQVLDQVDEKLGRSERRQALRRKFYQEAKDPKSILNYLEAKLKSHPDNIENYEELIYGYVAQDQLQKAVKTAKLLQRKSNDEPAMHWAFYKNYLQKGEIKKTVKELKALIKGENTGVDLKTMAIKDFQKLVKEHPDYASDLMYVLGEEQTDGNQSNQQLGEYYIGKDDTKALSYFEKALKETPNDFKLIKETLIVMAKLGEYNKVIALTEDRMDIFPTQAILYLYNGKAKNQQRQFSQAEEMLQDGMDFVIEDESLEFEFHKELVKTYEGLGKSEKAAEYRQKLGQ